VGGDCREYNGPVPIPNNPSGCPATQTKTCYTTNPRPNPPDNVSLEMEVKHQSEVELISLTPYPRSKLLRKLVQNIKAAGFDTDTVMGYWSNTHSGREISEYGVNNPVGLHAEYSDSDGQEDIVALYVWWSPKTSNTNLVLPNKLDTTGNLKAKTDTEDNWGFLITRSGYNGTWQNVYVPNLEGSNRIWVNAGNISETITVKGSSENTMVELSGINVRAVGSDEVHLDLLMTFRSEGTDDIVSTDQYNLWGLVNDYIGFIEFEENGEIKDSANSLWKDSNEDWTLDMIQPVISTLDVADTDKSQVTVSIDVNDDDNLSYVRLDACKSGIDAPSPLSSEYIDNYDLQTCDSFSGESIDVTTLNSLLGDEGDVRNLNTNSFSRDVDVYLGNNKEGAITFHLTVLDKAGNVKQDTEIYKLEQWATVKDGFVFGLNGVTSSTRSVDVDQWNGHPVLEDFRNSYVNEVDLTNQVLLGAKSLSSIFLRELVHTGSNLSFSVANYPGIFLGLPYQELKMAYENKAWKENIDLVTIRGDTLSGDLPTDCTTEHCILEREGNLLIDNFKCDRRALIAVNGDVTIQPNLTNDTDRDACIILASGDIQIGYGDRVTTESIPGYDIVEAFLIAGGKIDIPKQTEFDPPNDDGLYIEGGLISFTPPSGLESRSSVYNQREIQFSNMGVYPALVVDNNAKYGLLSKTVFGSQIDIYKTEVGFKPY
jgi:hypothetical protein